MLEELEQIASSALKEVDQAHSLENLESIRVSVLGKKGKLSQVLRGLKDVSAQERPRIGSTANRLKEQIEQRLALRREELESKVLEQKIANEKIDVTLPARVPHRGSLHPITVTTRRLVQALGRIGFSTAVGPDVETDFLNFEAVNIPKDHPARDMQDTFFVSPGIVLRTHTSPVQMRTMLNQPWPIRILCPGAVYRCDNDATHSPMFHQVEGLWVDRAVKMSDLKGTLEFFAKEIFGEETQIRLRPSYFPFVEPGAEVDASCMFCHGKRSDCRICKGTGWLEILGAGMVHPRLFETAGYDPKKVSGFAFGVGIDRIAMLLHGIPNIRMLFQNDLRFLRQF